MIRGKYSNIFTGVHVTKKHLAKPTADLIVLISQISHNRRASLHTENNSTIVLQHLSATDI